jgi:hypothetical protein
MDRKTLLVVANRAGGELLPDNGQWRNRIQIRSETSSNLYVVAQRISDGTWGCSCRGWIRHRNCKHLAAMKPLLEQAARQALAALPLKR